MKKINSTEFKRALEAKSETAIFVDVRTNAEFNNEHIEGVENIPLDEITQQVEKLNAHSEVYLHCQSGTRCQQAYQKIQNQLTAPNVFLYSGGLEEWKESKLPTQKNRRVLPIMRQVLITAGTLILLGFLLAQLGYAIGLYVMAFVGAGLLFAGLTGWCGMAKLLGLMPWNKTG